MNRALQTATNLVAIILKILETCVPQSYQKI